MSTLKLLCVGFLLALGAKAGLAADGPGLGQPVSEADLKRLDISIMPDGTGLPPGSGTAAQGAAIFAAECAMCHGENAKGGVNAALVGGAKLGESIDQVKTIANFWAQATTIFDYIRRAMPWPQPRSLSDD